MEIAFGLLGGSLPYMSPDRIVVLFGGVLAVLFAFFADLFIPAPRRVVRVGIAILGVVAVCSVVWQQCHPK